MSGTPGISNLFGSLRYLGMHQSSVATSLERLATGKKINRASDDPTGMVTATNLDMRQLKIDKLLERFEFEEAELGAKEGGLSVLQDLALELGGIVVRYANEGGLSDDELDALNTEMQGAIEGFNHIASSTFFNGQQILAGYDVGSMAGNLMELLKEDPEAAQEMTDKMTDDIAADRAAIGNRLRRIDNERNVLLEEFAANANVLSSVEDTDYATETAELIRAQILEQSALKAVQIDRQQAGRVLDLIASVPPIKPTGPSNGLL